MERVVGESREAHEDGSGVDDIACVAARCEVVDELVHRGLEPDGDVGC